MAVSARTGSIVRLLLGLSAVFAIPVWAQEGNPERNAYLLAGLRGAGHGRRALFTLPVAWLLGGLAGLSATAPTPHPFVAAAWFLLLGGLLAADAKVSLSVTTTLAALLGIHHGYLNGAGMGQFDTAAVALLGLVFAVFVLIALAAALVVRLRPYWARIAVRVAGSWIAASGLLMLGWAVRTR
jgi:urease accessory protein